MSLANLLELHEEQIRLEYELKIKELKDQLDDELEIGFEEARKLVNMGRHNFVHVINLNRDEIDVTRNRNGWIIFEEDSGGKYRIWKKRFARWWNDNPQKTIIRR